jgi:predicted site-specific integrase-resolvase
MHPYLPAPGPWLTSPQAATALNVSISTLYRWRNEGLLVPGEDWYRKTPSGRSTVLYNVDRVQKRIASLTARSAQELEAACG